MDKEEFTYFRKQLGKTQRQMADLLGTSLKAIHSYEQGWRNVPAHAERQLLFLASRKQENLQKLKSCWKVKKCLPAQKRQCPAWEFQVGKWCWFINGTICEGTVHRDWREKMKVCRKCEVLVPLFARDN